MVAALGLTSCEPHLTPPLDPAGEDARSAVSGEGIEGSASQAANRSVYHDRALGNAPTLEGWESAVGRLDPGQCLLEYGKPSGKWRRFVRTVTRSGSGPTVPFAVDYRLMSGRVVYRGTCNVAPADRDLAMEAISWAPGNGRLAAGKGWRSRTDSTPAGPAPPLPSRSSAEREVQIHQPSSVHPTEREASGSDPLAGYYHYDWCYVVWQGGEIVAVLYCGYYGDPDECDPYLDGPSGECEDPGGGSPDPDPDPEECDPEEAICEEASVECDLVELTRGEEISCTVADGADLDVEWEFTPTGESWGTLSANEESGTSWGASW